MARHQSVLKAGYHAQVSSTIYEYRGIVEQVLTKARYQALIRQYQSEIAANITLEQGKTHADAKGDVFRGLQVVDTACAIPSLLKGESVEVAKDMDTTSIREPLGVTGAICPFNFPAMSALRLPLFSSLAICR